MSNTLEHKQLYDIMGKSYIDYSMSVITERALPDVRDGLKPVQRRILWAMDNLKAYPNTPYRKVARIVGDTMGKFHPHGDSSIEGAVVYLAQWFNMGNVLVDGNGNFGSQDGDPPAAARYIEARLSKLSMEMIRDINSGTVDMISNFDNTENEPVVLPARFPNILVNGTQGIAVGMASNIPPHNLGESIDGCVAMLDAQMKNKDIDVEDLLKVIHGPDFPTGAVILGESYKDVYRTGKGKIAMECTYHIEPNGKNKENIIIDAIPFRVMKGDLVKAIAERVKVAKLDVTDVRDETSREGMRIVIELKKGAYADIIVNDLKKHTQLRSNFNANMLCIVNGKPMCLNLHDMLMYYLQHQEEIVTRRTRYDLNKAIARAHIIEGLLLAIDNIDEVIALIKGSKDTESAKQALIERFGLDDVQAQYIVDMRLKSLAGLETKKLKDELAELEKKITFCNKILSNRKELLKLIKKELLEIKKKYSTPRKTEHVMDYSDITMEDIISDDPVVIIRSAMGYIKRLSPEQFNAQKKGGKGSRGISTIENDQVTDVITTTAHAKILFFTTAGKVYSLKAYQIPENGKNARGTAIISLLKIPENEKITNVICATKDISADKYLMMITKMGIVKRVSFDKLPNIRANGLIMTRLKDGDSMISATVVGDDDNVMIITKEGQCLCYSAENVRSMGRQASGVHGIKLADDDEVVSVQPQIDGKEILIVTEKSYAKRIACSDFKTFKTRNGKGLKAIKAAKMKETGNVVSVLLVENSEDDVLFITDGGQVIRTPINKIPVYSRAARGTRTMRLEDEAVIADAATIIASAVEEFDDDE